MLDDDLDHDRELEVGHLHLAAFLLARGGGEVWPRLGRDGWVRFVIADGPAVTAALADWRADRALIDAKRFVAAQRMLQRLIAETRKGNGHALEAQSAQDVQTTTTTDLKVA